jgi:L-asparagine oxygenase
MEEVTRDVLDAQAALPAKEPPPQHRANQAGSARMRIVELTDAERSAAADAIAEHLLATAADGAIEPGTTDFFDAAEIVEGALPEPARAGIAALRRGSVDVLVLRGLPSDPDPGPTPTQAGELPATPPPLANSWLALAVRRLGHEYCYALEKKGSLVHNVHPTKEGAATQSNASFSVDLSLHTENAFHPIRPDYVCLYCVRTTEDSPATRLVTLDDVLAHLTDHELSVLRETRFTISVVDSHKAEGEADIELPVSVLNGPLRHPTVRWHETLRPLDDVAARAAKAFADAATEATRFVRLQPGDLLAFANERCLHGRDRFDARLDGTDRWLLRGYVLRDLTRTMSFVAPARPRVTRVDLAAQAAG